MENKTERFELRAEPSFFNRIDDWRSKQPDCPPRAEATRRLIELGLVRDSYLSKGEMFIAQLLCELLKPSKDRGTFSPDFITKAISGGHLWALGWEYSGVFHDSIDTPRDVTEVVSILDMWTILKRSYKELQAEDKSQVQNSVQRFDANMSFPGFDSTDEVSHWGIARFLIYEMRRFGDHKDDEYKLDSHCPFLPRYRKMLHIFQPIKKNLMGGLLSAQDIISILNV